MGIFFRNVAKKKADRKKRGIFYSDAPLNQT